MPTISVASSETKLSECEATSSRRLHNSNNFRLLYDEATHAIEFRCFSQRSAGQTCRWGAAWTRPDSLADNDEDEFLQDMLPDEALLTLELDAEKLQTMD